MGTHMQVHMGVNLLSKGTSALGNMYVGTTSHWICK